MNYVLRKPGGANQQASALQGGYNTGGNMFYQGATGPRGSLSVIDALLLGNMGINPADVTPVGQGGPDRKLTTGGGGMVPRGPVGPPDQGGLRPPDAGGRRPLPPNIPRPTPGPIAGMPMAFNPGQLDPSKIGKRLPRIPGREQNLSLTPYNEYAGVRTNY